MKRFLQCLLFALLSVFCGGCSDDDNGCPEPEIDVTPNNIAGVWRLAESSGGLSDDTYVYIEFTRRDQTFTIYQNIDSFSLRVITGTYNIYTDEESGAIIRGSYDHGNGDWSHRYIVRMTSGRMTWTAKDDADNISVYERCDTVPDDILSEAAE